ncbi:MAG: PHP domain-containing protein, partial [Pseudomonadota bacterium]|nr:PHP domain-containing protein [Pseudomonadota bacterium]
MSETEIIQSNRQLMLPKFIHLRVHSAFSLLEGALSINLLSRTAQSMRMPALAVTDRNNLFGALEFSETMAALGIQPIIGATLSVYFGVDDEPPCSLALLVKNETGYRNLMALASAAHLKDRAHSAVGIDVDLLDAHGAGLICLTGGPEGPVNQHLSAGRAGLAEDVLARLQGIFSDSLYIELQRYADGAPADIEDGLVQLAYAREVPLVATNQAYFASEDDYRAHDALVCIAEGRYLNEEDRRRLTPDHRLKTAEEMVALFADLPEALENTVEIAQRCAFRPTEHKPILPAFAEGDELAELRRQAEEGLRVRLQQVSAA